MGEIDGDGRHWEQAVQNQRRRTAQTACGQLWQSRNLDQGKPRQQDADHSCHQPATAVHGCPVWMTLGRPPVASNKPSQREQSETAGDHVSEKKPKAPRTEGRSSPGPAQQPRSREEIAADRQKSKQHQRRHERQPQHLRNGARQWL